MSLNTTINFDNPANFTYDNAKGEVTTDAHLRQVGYSLAYDQPFSSDTGFSNINPALAQIAGGQFIQIDQKTPNTAFYVNYNADENLNWGVGISSLTGTLFNGATVSGGELILNNNNEYVEYNGLGASVRNNIVTIKFKYIPQYSGTPGFPNYIFTLDESNVSNNNRLRLLHNTAGDWRIYVTDDAGATVYNGQGLGSTLTFVSGQEYALQLNFDFVNNVVEFFIDGVQQGLTLNPAPRTYGTRGNLRFGLSGQNHNFRIGEAIVFRTIQTVDTNFNYPNKEYLESRATMPTASYDGIGGITGFSISDLAGGSTPRYTVNGYYWTGAAWAVSNNTFAQASTKIDIIANSITHPVIGVGNTLTFDVYLQEGNTRQFITQFNSQYTGLQYTTLEGISFEPNTAQLLDNVDNITVNATIPAGTEIRYVRSANGNKEWFDGNSFVASDLSYSQSNDLATFLANVNDQKITDGATFKLIPILYSTDIVETPLIVSYSLDYNFYFTGCTPSTCVVYGCVKDNSGVGIAGAKVRFNSDDYRYVSALITREVVATTDELGRFDIPIVETASTSTTVTIVFEYRENGKTRKITYEGITIPNQASVDLDALLP